MISFNLRYGEEQDLLAAKERLLPIRPQHLLIQVFCGVPTEEAVSELIGHITSVFPGVPMVGTTTAGEIMEGEALDQETVVSFTQFEKTRIRSALVGQNDDLFLAGLKLATGIRQNEMKAAIVFGCGIKNGGAINGEPLLAGLQRHARTF